MYTFEVFVRGYPYPLTLNLEFRDDKEAQIIATTMMDMLLSIDVIHVYKNNQVKSNLVNIIRGE